ncbi:MAG: hypothetical protein QNJ16_07285 [Rhodobacter sp.]|nr:hypothetical protein [Rhodobacter sp.]
MAIAMSLRNFVLIFSIIAVFLAVSRVLEPPGVWLHHSGLTENAAPASHGLSEQKPHHSSLHSHMAHDRMAPRDHQAPGNPDSTGSECCCASALLTKCPFKFQDAAVALHQIPHLGGNLPWLEVGALWRTKSVILDVVPGPPRRA